jgi:translocation and assembly module TamB
MATRPVRRGGLVLTGALAGLFVVALVLWLYLRLAQVGGVERAVTERLELPAGTLELEELTDAGELRISMRDVVLRGDAGDTVVIAPRVSLRFDPSTTGGDGPLEFSEVVLYEPDVRLAQSPAGEWNLLQALRLEANGEAVGGDAGGMPLLFSDVSVEGGRVAIAVPGEPVDTATFAGRLNFERQTIRGTPYQVYRFEGVHAHLSRVLLGGEEGWVADVQDLSTQLVRPDVRIAGMRGRFASEGDDGVRFAVQTLRLGASSFAGAGTIRFAGDAVEYDVEVEAAPLHFSDLAGLIPGLPEEGTASFALSTEPLGAGRTALLFSGLDVDALDATVTGRLGMVVGGDAAPLFRDTDLAVASLRLSVLETLGLVQDLPVAGVVAGTLATEGTVTAGLEGALRVDLTARVTPADSPGDEPSVIAAVGGLGLGGPGEGVRLAGLQLQLQPLHLATLRPFAPDQADRLRGTARGAVTVSGTTSELRLSDGTVTYEVGDAPPTVLAELGGTVALDPLVYDIRAEARPLALATLTELFPGLPFRTATLTGPIELTGDAGRVSFSTDLEGPAGALAMRGRVVLGETPAFDVSGNVHTLTPAALLRADLPVEGAVTGTFAARGTVEDLRFEVDLEQTAGRFALAGRMLADPSGGPPTFDVGGDVSGFRIGALLGQPGLFPAPMTGRLDLSGGGAAPYVFDVDLRGDDVVLDIEGSFAAGDIPRYSVRGTVLGLDLSRLPLAVPLPRSDLNATVQIDGMGTTLETLQGSYFVNARGSTIGGIPLDAGLLRAEARGGLLLLDTVDVRLADNRLSAAGAIGLTAPSDRPLTFSFVSPDLSTLARAASTAGLPTEMAGSVSASGWFAGSLRNPRFALGLSGRGLQYGAWAAGDLTVEADVSRTPALGWAGEANVVGERLTLATGETLERVQLSVTGDQQRLGVGLYARRDGGSDISASGIVELIEGGGRGLTMESLAVRLDGSAWSLVSRSNIRWGGVDGIAIDNLQLERTDGGEGSILVHGLLPPTGAADLQIRIADLGLGSVASLFPAAPPLGGVLSMDAVLEGPVSDPTLSLIGRVDSLEFQGAVADSVSITADYIDRNLQADAFIWRDGVQLLGLEGRVPMLLSLEDLLPSFRLIRDAPLFARAIADSLDLALLTAAVPQLADGAGSFTADARVSGTIDRPELEGEARVQDGAVRVIPLGVTYSAIAAGVSLQGQRIVIDSVTAVSDGTGRIAGTIAFREGGGPDLDLAADLSSFEVMDDEDVASVRLTGVLALTGALPQPVLTGEITIDESTFVIPDLTQRSTVELTNIEIGQIGPDTVAPTGFGPAFLANTRIEGLVVSVGESVWLTSDDARIQIAGEDLIVYRTGEELRVFGVLRAERGTYALRIGPLVREFDIVSGSVQFFGTGDINPELDIVAANRIRTLQAGGGTTFITILVNISGTVRFPRISLSSDTRPPLPESEILSLLLFGRPTFGLGGAAGQLAQEVLVQEAIGGILFAPLEQIFLQTGLIDYVQFRSVGGEIGQVGQTLGLTTVEIGTQLSDNIFLTLECGVGMIFGGIGGAACGTRLEMELGRSFTAVAAYEPTRRDRLLQVLSADVLEHQWSLELRKRWEYGISRGDPGLAGPEPEFPDRVDPDPAPADRDPVDPEPIDREGGDPAP